MSSWYSDRPDDYYTTPDADPADLVRLSSSPVSVEVERDERMAWMRDAACVGVDPKRFDDHTTKETRMICAACPVLEDCFGYTMQHALTVGAGEEHYGFQAGLSAAERKRLVSTMNEGLAA